MIGPLLKIVRNKVINIKVLCHSFIVIGTKGGEKNFVSLV